MSIKPKEKTMFVEKHNPKFKRGDIIFCSTGSLEGTADIHIIAHVKTTSFELIPGRWKKQSTNYITSNHVMLDAECIDIRYSKISEVPTKYIPKFV